ncbi:DUF6665 family protein [Nitratireductor thuwali]|uniref:Uncharacterized protein n=1 Tax=Nitratireductor thuwali TaxID=2267699 RepID=A0ABY5MHX1_9HYPH|nr:hypothetical protein NTH_00808 [Nitratireductor thuwali]
MSGDRKSSLTRTGIATLDYELAEEMAVALGEAGRRAERALARLHAQAPDEADPALLKAAADAVYAYFIQRELCGLKRHDAVIHDMGIPRKVLARLGSC